LASRSFTVARWDVDRLEAMLADTRDELELPLPQPQLTLVGGDDA